jgi:hypothetical protein
VDSVWQPHWSVAKAMDFVESQFLIIQRGNDRAPTFCSKVKGKVVSHL